VAAGMVVVVAGGASVVVVGVAVVGGAAVVVVVVGATGRPDRATPDAPGDAHADATSNAVRPAERDLI